MTIETRACWQPWDSLNIAADGKVYPCCVVHPRLEIGDLNGQSLEQIVTGEKAADLRRNILLGNISKLPCLECCNAPMLPVETFKRDIADRFFSAPRSSAPQKNQDEQPEIVTPIRELTPKDRSLRKRMIRLIDRLYSTSS